MLRQTYFSVYLPGYYLPLIGYLPIIYIFSRTPTQMITSPTQFKAGYVSDSVSEWYLTRPWSRARPPAVNCSWVSCLCPSPSCSKAGERGRSRIVDSCSTSDQATWPLSSLSSCPLPLPLLSLIRCPYQTSWRRARLPSLPPPHDPGLWELGEVTSLPAT